MNLFELFVKIGVDDQASGQLKKITASLGNGIKTAAKVGLGAITAVSAGIAGLTKLSIDQYKEYEQLVGGAQLMFGDAYDYVADKAKNAFSTVQMSQNQYLQQANSFAVGLMNSFGDAAGAISEETAEQMIKSLDKQVDAFEDATEQQIKLINKQYTESMKLIDEEEYQRLKAIDDEIAAINALTEAEQEAFEKEEQEQRKSELQKRIENAKTREEREKAEEDLADYIEQIRYEEVLEQRNIEIEKLKAKKDAIKEEMDSRRQALKEQQEYELETYKETRDKELEYLKDHLEQQEKAIMESVGSASKGTSASNDAYMKAAELADRIINAQADVVAATGVSQEAVANAFGGLMKNNFTMLDNLQLGITPTKEGFQEVIDKVNEWNEANGNLTNYQMGNLADMQSALVDYIEMQGLAGYAAKEAQGTITGSWGMLSGAWQNLLTGFADSEADVGILLDNVIDSVFIFGKNLVPRISTILTKMFDLAKEAVPVLFKSIGDNLKSGISMVKENLPIILSEIPMALTSFFENNADTMAIGFLIAQRMFESFANALPSIVEKGASIVSTLAKGIGDNIGKLTASVYSAVVYIAEILTRPEVLTPLLEGALAIIVGLADALYLIAGNEELQRATYQIILNLTEFLVRGDILKMVADAAIQIGAALLSAVVEGVQAQLPILPEVFQKIIDIFFEPQKQKDAWDKGFAFGQNIGEKMFEGLKSMFIEMQKAVEKFFGDLFDDIAEKLGFENAESMFNFAEVEFNKSGIGKVGANTINAIGDGMSTVANKIGLGEVNLVLPDGTKFAEYLLPDLEGVSRARGTPIIQPT